MRHTPPAQTMADGPELPALSAAIVGAVVFLAFFVRGVSGFGSATIAIPLLAHQRISNEQALRVIGTLLILSGISLLAKVWL